MTLRQAGPLDEIGSAAAVSAFFVRDDAEQSERMAPRLWAAEWRSSRRSCGDGSSTIIRCTFEALVQRIGSMLRQFPDSSRIHLVFSAHGLPMSLVEKGDPYPKQIEETVRLVCEAGAQEYAGWPRTHLLCYQSRVGPAKWLQPPLTGTIERLGHEGVKEMLVVPISFVTEHIETLHEINIEARTKRRKLALRGFG